MSKPAPIQDDVFSKLNVKHGFFTREGGVSKGIYAGLNVGLGSDDNRSYVLENRSRVANHFDADPDCLISPYQVHSADVIEVREPWEEGYRPKVDALVTRNPDIAIGILTADCGPVLFADAENSVIGAAHAGWKGATGGVLDNTVSAMETIGAEREHIVAVLGPTISQENYEVGPEFVERLIDIHPDNKDYLVASEKPEHFMFDLPAYIIARLTIVGVKAHWSEHCTYADEESFFSYRRTTHRKEADYGRQISAISLGAS